MMLKRLTKYVQTQNEVVKHGVVYLTSRVGTKILAFLMLPIWTAFLSPSEYGVIGLINAYVGMSVPFILLGLPSAMVRQYHDYKDVWSGYLKTIFLSIVGSLIFIYLGMLLWDALAGERAPMLVSRYRYVFCFSLLGGALTQLAVAGLQAERASKQFIIGNFVSYFSGLAISLILVVAYHMGSEGFLYGMSLGALIGVGYIIWSRRQWWCVRADGIKLIYLKYGLKYGYVLVPAAVAGWGVNFSSRLVVENYHSLHEVGLFSFAGNIAMIVSFVMVSLVQAWVPAYYAARKNEESQAVEKSNSQIEKIILYVGGAVLIGLSTVGALFISSIVSSRYAPAMPLILPLGIGYLFYGLINVETRGFMFSGKNARVSLLYTLAALLTVGFSIALVPTQGAYGASLASMAALIIAMFVTVFVSRRSGEGVVNNFVILFFMTLSGTCLLLDHYLPSMDFMAWVLRSVSCLLLLGLLFLTVNRRYKNDVCGA